MENCRSNHYLKSGFKDPNKSQELDYSKSNVNLVINKLDKNLKSKKLFSSDSRNSMDTFSQTFEKM